MQGFFFVQNNKKYLKISFSDIKYIEAVKKYVKIFTATEIHVVSVSMCYAETQLPEQLFCRIHKSYIVSLLHTRRFDNDSFHIADKILPIGKHYKNILLKKVNVWGKQKDEGLNIEANTLSEN